MLLTILHKLVKEANVILVGYCNSEHRDLKVVKDCNSFNEHWTITLS
jgi:hypothetical protein